MTAAQCEIYVADLLVPLFAAWAAAAGFGRFAIPLLQRLHVSQTEREAGLQSHKKKSGTPTMGGVIFLLPFLVVTLISAGIHHGDGTGQAAALIAVLIPTIGFGAIGFLDDYLKVIRHNNLGLRVRQKLALQIFTTVIFALWLHFISGISISEMWIPFAGHQSVRLGYLSFPALLIIALATTNGTNLTDGVDGLCASVTVPVTAFFALASFLAGTRGAIGVPAAAAMAGALLGYLYYNYYPAKIFMGDTGSLAIGGFLVGITYVLKLPLFVPIAGIIYTIEVISVVLQVSYFKATKGKRLFRMAPIHHHFEKGGWSETRVVGVFTTITVLACLTGLVGLTV